jgi:hypothetical protein
MKNIETWQGTKNVRKANGWRCQNRRGPLYLRVLKPYWLHLSVRLFDRAAYVKHHLHDKLSGFSPSFYCKVWIITSHSGINALINKAISRKIICHEESVLLGCDTVSFGCTSQHLEGLWCLKANGILQNIRGYTPRTHHHISEKHCCKNLQYHINKIHLIKIWVTLLTETHPYTVNFNIF